MKKNIITTEIIIKENKVGILKIGDKEYISLTDLARYADNDEPRLPIRDWRRNKKVISFLGLWESIHNENFKRGEFDTFKNEAYQLKVEWSATRLLSKVNYVVRTDAIKEYIVPTLTEEQIKFIYAEEADVLNVALFGMTAKK